MEDYNDPIDSTYQIPQKKSKKVWWIISILILIIIIGVVAFLLINSVIEKSDSEDTDLGTNNGDTTGTEDTTTGINPEEIILDILLPKDTYEINEEVIGDYYLKYQGEPFEGAIIYCSASGVQGCAKTVGMLDDIDFSDPEKTNFLKVALSGGHHEEGSYTYSIYVYDCRDINEAFNRDDCGGRITSIEDIITNVFPLKTKLKTIVVVAGDEVYTPECTTNDDCTQTCTNCDGGTYVCASSSNISIDQTCVECITNFGCVDGYECDNHICVVEEQEPDDDDSEEYPVTDPLTILDCYSDDLTEILCSPEDALAFTELFGERLVPCEISDGTFALGFEPFFGIFRGYEIQEEQGDNCIVKYWFLENSVIDPSLLNKEMVCEYDSSQRTTQDVADCLDECCTGDLVDALNEIF